MRAGVKEGKESGKEVCKFGGKKRREKQNNMKGKHISVETEKWKRKSMGGRELREETRKMLRNVKERRKEWMKREKWSESLLMEGRKESK